MPQNFEEMGLYSAIQHLWIFPGIELNFGVYIHKKTDETLVYVQDNCKDCGPSLRKLLIE